MHAVHRHLEHLSQILIETHATLVPGQPDNARLDTFFRTIAAEYIRIGRCDWRGHAVSTLLWHLPNLRPHGRSALTLFILHQWEQLALSDKAAVPPALRTANSLEPKAAPSLPEIDDPPEIVHAVPKETKPEGQPFWKTFPEPRRDWFDRFTDWVAATLSLFQ